MLMIEHLDLKKLKDNIPQLESLLNQQVKFTEELGENRKQLLNSLQVIQNDFKRLRELEKKNIMYIKYIRKYLRIAKGGGS